MDRRCNYVVAGVTYVVTSDSPGGAVVPEPSLNAIAATAGIAVLVC